MAQEIELQCLDCGYQTRYRPGIAHCPQCGSEWLQAVYDYGQVARLWREHLLSRPFDLWRYHELLPVRHAPPETAQGEGGTPVYPARHLSMMLKLPYIFIKDERQNPTSSFKDRQAAVTIAALKEAGLTDVVVASTGNVAIAYSAYASRAGIKLWAFLSSAVPAEKMREVAIYGTQVIKVTGTYDQTKLVAARFARERGFYLDRGARSVPTVESMKTLAFEIAEQLGRLHPDARYGQIWMAPDWYIQAVSGGLGPLGVAKGFQELYDMGFIDRMPKLGIIQAAGCDPMVQAWEQGRAEPVALDAPSTHISTLATGRPGRTYTLLYEYVQQHGGVFIRVTDEEAFRTMHMMAKMEGISMEPAAAVAFAGLIRMAREGLIQPHETVVVNCTGHTMPIESHLLGDRWATEVAASEALQEAPGEGLLTALAGLDPKRHPKVLIVDDHEPARILFRRVLQSLGEYQILEAENGRQALEMARKHHPNLIILDLMMPGMDGFQVLERLKQDPETALIPVIVVTAKHLTAQERHRVHQLARSLLIKGEFLSDEFFEEIRTLLEEEGKGAR